MVLAVRLRKARALPAGLALALAAPLLSACFAEPTPHEAVSQFLVGWQSGDYAAAAERTDGDPKAVRKALEDASLQLDAASIRFSIKGLTSDGDNADAKFRVQVDLGDNNPIWSYDNDLPLHVVDGSWKVRWSSKVIHPQLGEGQRFAVKVSPEGDQPIRQPIEDRNGDALQQDATLYLAGVYPDRVKDPVGVCERLFQLTGFAQDRLLARIRSAPPQDFVPLVTFGAKKYAQLLDRLEEIGPDLVIEKQAQPVAPAQPADIIGRVGAITAETMQQLGGPQRAGDTIGQGGLQKAYQEQLTGSTGTEVITYDLKTGEQVAELARWPGRTDTTSVRTTIDKGVQRSADLAVSGQSAALLLAVDAPTGQIRAVASKGFDQLSDGLNGRFPPGTTFSIVAADGLLAAGLDPGQKLPCPADRTVGGARFQQAQAQSTPQPQTTGQPQPTGQPQAEPPAGDTPTVTAGFAQGCVTALASLARRVNATALTQSAARFGIGQDWRLPLRTFSGSVPAAAGDAAKAKIIAGQSVRVSPLSMALVAGALASGTWRPPTLVTSPATPDTDSEVAPAPAPRPVTLAAESLTKLRALMRAGVTSGSATAAAAPGEKVYGVSSAVTFTETDSGKKRQRHLNWFVGWQGDMAVAVLAETGDATVAPQIAGQFFRNARTAA
ncbi:penicillin-binding protein [Sphaerisporangium melleum]|uniref:Penicillin-binding protein n=1 Tax=Sphaerisporangium melleum TaxID=321316 RepID=A0A917QRU2_9ACTN|nr:penicillin-binding transpeptidase domain-containing protein [Sphaerisporangium melleum]GGK64484.1 penicillin-binding protein [Sphaerisporangium melleum]GII70073.1 penicillin-binding protein [Sphaerisporangium melleum]